MMAFPPSYRRPEHTAAEELEHERQAEADRCPELASDWDGFWRYCEWCGQSHYLS